MFSKRTNLKLVASFCVVYNYCQLLFTFPAVDFCDFDLYRANSLLILLSFQSCAQHSYRFFSSCSSFVYLSFLVRFNFFVFFLVRFSFLLLLSHSEFYFGLVGEKRRVDTITETNGVPGHVCPTCIEG